MLDDPRLPERVWSKIAPEPNSGCWLWTGGWDKEGYGKSSLDGRHLRAHRLTFEALVGPIPEGLQLDHLCRVPCCVNPAHLEPVTSRENQLRGSAYRPFCPSGHRYDESNTKYTVNGARYCQECHRANTRRIHEGRRARKKAAGTYVPSPGKRTHCPKGHPYDEANTNFTPAGHRGCRTCILARLSAYQKSQVTHCPQGHPYDEGNTYLNSAGIRRCETCRHNSKPRRE